MLRHQFLATVVSNEPLCREHFRLTLRLPSFPFTAPGQFVQVSCRDASRQAESDGVVEWEPGQVPQFAGAELHHRLALLRRPFSLAGRRDVAGGVELQLIHRVVGVGTEWLSQLQPDGEVDLIGPLGNRFTLPPQGGHALLIGGGVGIPPMLYLAEALAGRKVVAFCGATSRDLLPLTVTDDAPPPARDGVNGLYNIAEFSRHGIPAVITTDDGSYGFAGYVTHALEKYLDLYFANTWDVGSVRPILYTCGPEPMMKRVAEIALTRGLPCQIAVERAMACGMGTCQSCVIKVKTPRNASKSTAASDWVYRLACTDGPVFQAADLLW